MAFISGTNSSTYIVSQLPADAPSADTSSSFCSEMITCILKIVTAVRDFFVWLFCCSKQEQNPTLAAPVVPDASGEAFLYDSESTEDLGEMRDVLDLDSD